MRHVIPLAAALVSTAPATRQRAALGASAAWLHPRRVTGAGRLSLAVRSPKKAGGGRTTTTMGLPVVGWVLNPAVLFVAYAVGAARYALIQSRRRSSRVDAAHAHASLFCTFMKWSLSVGRV